MFDLRTWLRNKPKPARLRITTEAGEDRIIELARNPKWNAIADTVRASGAVSVQALGADDNVLRARKLSDDDLESNEDARTSALVDQRAAQHAAAQAAMLDRYGHRMTEAFHAGASAAAVSQENLVELVRVLTHNLSTAITNFHAVSVNLANLVQAQAAENPEGLGGKMVESMLTGMAAKMMGAGLEHPDTNGKKK